jgi:outer membrane protein assembly factor BamA
VYRAATTHYSDRSTGVFSFTEYEGEALQFVPVVSDKWVLALHGWALFSDVPAGHEIPFYLLPSIGGQNSVRSFRSYRFHDNNLLLVNAESRLRLTEHIDWAVFGDAGNVASRFADLNLDKTAVGVGIRLHTDTTTVARMDVAHGSEGWLWVFRTSEPLRLARIARQVALMPFTP